MKRSEINKALKDMHDLIKNFMYHFLHFVNGHQKSGKQKGKNTMKLEIICLAGI